MEEEEERGDGGRDALVVGTDLQPVHFTRSLGTTFECVFEGF